MEVSNMMTEKIIYDVFKSVLEKVYGKSSKELIKKAVQESENYLTLYEANQQVHEE